MPKNKKSDTLTDVEKDYITLSLKYNNNVNYDQLFKTLALKIGKSENLIRDYADKKTDVHTADQLPVEPKKKVKPEQEALRNLMTPNRLTEDNKARHVTIMSEMASEQLDKKTNSTLKGSSKIRDSIFRQ